MLLYAFPRAWNKMIKLTLANYFSNIIFTLVLFLWQNKILHSLRQKGSPLSSWISPSPKILSLVQFCVQQTRMARSVQSRISKYCIISKRNLKPVISVTLWLVNWYHQSCQTCISPPTKALQTLIHWGL